MVARTLAAVLFLAAMAPVSIGAAEQQPSGEKRGARVGTGDIAPDFTLVDQDGRQHTLSVERRQRPVVLIFYRGHW